jgi:hypothetical protein
MYECGRRLIIPHDPPDFLLCYSHASFFFLTIFDMSTTSPSPYCSLWGQITDDASLDLIDSVFQRSVTDKGGMHYLDEKIQFTMTLV